MKYSLWNLRIGKHVRRVWRYQKGNQNIEEEEEEEETTQYSKEKGQKDKQRSTNIHIKSKIE